MRALEGRGRRGVRAGGVGRRDTVGTGAWTGAWNAASSANVPLFWLEEAKGLQLAALLAEALLGARHHYTIGLHVWQAYVVTAEVCLRTVDAEISGRGPSHRTDDYAQKERGERDWEKMYISEQESCSSCCVVARPPRPCPFAQQVVVATGCPATHARQQRLLGHDASMRTKSASFWA